MIVFHRFDLGENDFEFLEFDTVPKVVFYPKAIHGMRTELRVFDAKMQPLDYKIIVK